MRGYELQSITAETLTKDLVDEMAQLYQSDFVPAPIRDANPEFYDIGRFRDRVLENYASMPNFETVIIRRGTALAGFITAANLNDSHWWEDITTSSAVDTVESGSRTLAIFDLLVGSDFRGRKLASVLHAAVLSNTTIERVTLLSSPPQQPAFSMWQHWGYLIVGRVQFSPNDPELDLFLKTCK